MSTDESRIVLPEAPAELADRPLRVWSEPVVIDTYAPAEPDRYPAYLDQRVYQGSSGRVYPLPFIDAIAKEKTPRRWEAIHLENEYVRLMLLPELGGRIHLGVDKTRGYDFFYRNDVIKPALVGLAGPWVSGGVEFNWPQHHRPATHLPTETRIEHEPDGAATVWCADHDPFARMRGMHGIRLRPGSALIELRGRLTNRTDEVQTFMWWANVAARAGEDYQSFFPADVRAVADHAKRATATFPAARGSYYGVDYPARRTADRPDGDRLDWYRNIPVPTSYMCLDSTGDFFGGYDHAAGAGFVHWADHRISPGKKLWTWGDAPFGRAWEAHLSDGSGPYVELMAGVFTDNQPDFAFLRPGETKSFSQYWYPIQDTGPVHQATLEAAVRLDADGARVRIGAAATAARPGARITLRGGDRILLEDTADLAPGAPYVTETALDAPAEDLEVSVVHGGDLLVSWRPGAAPEPPAAAAPAAEPPAPADIDSVDELYQTGLHLDQYRHATRSPEPYWQEALRRDPADARCNTALAARRLSAGLLDEAEAMLRRAVGRLTRWNPNPRDGEAHYRLGLTLARLRRDDEAREAFGKALWDAAWADAAALATARLDLAAGRDAEAAAGLAELIERSPRHWQARNLAALAAVRSGDLDRARELVRGTLDADGLDAWARDLAVRFDLAAAAPTTDPAIALDVALEYRSAGADEAAADLLETAASLTAAPGQVNVAPLAWLHRADLEFDRGDEAAADAALQRVAELDRTWCFPSHTEDDALARLRARRPADPVLAALAGHRLYAAGRRTEAVAAWEAAAETGDPVVLRNLGVAAHNVQKDAERAAHWYALARRAAPDDARLLYESDQLDARRGIEPGERLAALERRRDLIDQRDDLSVQHAELLTAVGRAAEAVAALSGRRFQPWEGGEGRVLAAWEEAHLALARAALAAGEPRRAVEHARAALDPPPNLGESRHELANTADLHLLLGDALAAAGEPDAARAAWERAAAQEGDFHRMRVESHSEHTAAAVAALRRLGEPEAAAALRDDLARYIERQAEASATVDYFATSLPEMLLFTADVQAAHDTRVLAMRAQLARLDGEADRAASLARLVLARDPLNSAARAVAADPH